MQMYFLVYLHELKLSKVLTATWKKLGFQS